MIKSNDNQVYSSFVCTECPISTLGSRHVLCSRKIRISHRNLVYLLKNNVIIHQRLTSHSKNNDRTYKINVIPHQYKLIWFDWRDQMYVRVNYWQSRWPEFTNRNGPKQKSNLEKRNQSLNIMNSWLFLSSICTNGEIIAIFAWSGKDGSPSLPSASPVNGCFWW